MCKNGISIRINMLVNEKYREEMQSVLNQVENKVLDMVEEDLKDKIMFLNGEGKFIKIKEVKEGEK